MATFEHGGFPEGYDPHQEVEEMMGENGGDRAQEGGEDHRREALSEAVAKFSNARPALEESWGRFRQGVGLSALGGVGAVELTYLATNFPQQLAGTQEMNGALQGDILLGALTTALGAATAGGLVMGLDKLLSGIRGMRQSRSENDQAKGEVRAFGGNTEALR